MHSKFQRADELSHLAIGAAIEAHKLKGPGLIESIFEKCLMRELFLRDIEAQQQLRVPIEYKGLVFEEPLRLDVLLEENLVLELKVVEKFLPIHKAQLLSYMKLRDVPLGLIINFQSLRLVDGVHRLILPGADKPENPPSIH
ncbi:GxxExxY protein [Haloferula sp. A504]|uniref:GxxExxY protein n=1 Tax=Haloferula sp. A504 TaxID=3373601 RepID=UPI0031BD5151|nr:GxxExxY protein [Verrucomicrobiaceae bacterium E54]